MIISQPKTSFLGVVFDGDHDFEGPRAPKARLDTVNANLSHHLGTPRTHKPARDLLEQRLVAAIGFTAQSYLGAHRVAARGARILGGGAGGCAASAW